MTAMVVVVRMAVMVVKVTVVEVVVEGVVAVVIVVAGLVLMMVVGVFCVSGCEDVLAVIVDGGICKKAIMEMIVLGCFFTITTVR